MTANFTPDLFIAMPDTISSPTTSGWTPSAYHRTFTKSELERRAYIENWVVSGNVPLADIFDKAPENAFYINANAEEEIENDSSKSTSKNPGQTEAIKKYFDNVIAAYEKEITALYFEKGLDQSEVETLFTKLKPANAKYA